MDSNIIDVGKIDAKAIIEKLGGIRPTASKLGVAISTVQGWKERGRIPNERIEAIVALVGEDFISESATNTADKTTATSSTAHTNNKNTAKTLENGKNTAKMLEKAKKSSQNGKSTGGLSIFISLTALIVSLTVPLWIDMVYTPTTPNTEKVVNNTQSIENLSINYSALQKQMQDVVKAINGTGETLSKTIEAVNATDADIKDLQQEVSKQLEIVNKRTLILRQMTSIALIGEPYGVLLPYYSLTEKQAEDKNLTTALDVLKANGQGVRSVKYLTEYLIHNARIVSPIMLDKNATTIWDKVKSKLENVIYISKIENLPKANVSPLSELIVLLRSGDLPNAILKARAYDNKHLNNWADMVEIRHKTLMAFSTLLGIQ